ncbi:hypothetical protein NWF32_09770 [Pseudomonas qingdaonensis]|nr:hypothetical protein [Pseudomonas qingdaonensis]
MGAAKVLYAILVTTLLLFWLNQNSISLYCQQKYHQSCELPWVGQSQAWRLGGNLTQALGMRAAASSTAWSARPCWPRPRACRRSSCRPVCRWCWSTWRSPMPRRRRLPRYR